VKQEIQLEKKGKKLAEIITQAGVVTRPAFQRLALLKNEVMLQ
jgi:hypothetical protein